MDLLLLEDDHDLGQAVAEHLRAAGHRVAWCRSIGQARRAAPPAMALIDLGLPDGDALGLLREWRAGGHGFPVIAITARDQVSDRIRGLQAGADDYLVKPFDLDELLARIEAVGRRGQPGRRLRAGELAIDIDGRRVEREGRAVPLTAMEWTVLERLAASPGRIVTRGAIDDALADRGLAQAESNSLEVIVSRLRRKLGHASIRTHRGLGYQLDGGTV